MNVHIDALMHIRETRYPDESFGFQREKAALDAAIAALQPESARGERQALSDLLDYVDAQTCTHESTHRGGSIWTVCDDCDRKWADDEGGFVPHEDAPAVAAAREALAAHPQQAPAQATCKDSLQGPPAHGDGEGVPFDVVREVVKARTRLGFASPEGQEEQAARAVELIRELCEEVIALTTRPTPEAQEVRDAVEVVQIPRSKSLDPITVYLTDFGSGAGRATVVCYNQAWTCFWGSMGCGLRDFIRSCDKHYVAGNMVSGRARVLRHERDYAERIAQAVIDALALPAQGEGE